jgi:hypothetical protein
MGLSKFPKVEKLSRLDAESLACPLGLREDDDRGRANDTMLDKLCTTLLGFITVFAWPGNAFSADIKSVVGKDGRIAVSIVGEIAPGDSDAFSAAVKQANDAGKFVANVRLNSEGGNLFEGVKLADAVRFGRMSTNVGKDATCASACFFIFAAGNTKFASYDARIGVHGASDKNGDETVQSGAATVSMARIAQELGVPAAIIGRMVVTPPDDMVWLTPQDLQSMGTTMIGKPNQTQAMPPMASEKALRQTPESPSASLQSKSAATESAPLPTWNGLLENALELSKKQNGGTADFDRACQPEVKTCVNGFSFTAKDGTYMIMKVTENLDGKIIRREICSFNLHHDVRSCVDWDKGSTHRDMKNSKGAWETVSED